MRKILTPLNKKKFTRNWKKHIADMPLSYNIKNLKMQATTFEPE